MSTGWTDRQKTIWTNRHQLHVWTDRWTDRRTNGQTSQAVAIVGWVVLDFYGRMLVSVATNAATILIAHRAPPTPPMPSSLAHEAVILVAAGYQWQQCATSANSTLTSHSSNLAMPIMRNFCYLLSQTVGWIALARIVLWHCSIAPSLDYFWYFKWCTYVNAYGSRRSIVHKHPWKCERTFSRTLGVCLVMECSPQNDI